MALQTINAGIWIPEIFYSTQRTADFLIDATGEKCAFIVQVPKTGTISKVGFMTGAVATSVTLRAGLETVGAANGDPTGTQYGGSAVGTQAAPAANTFYTVSLGTAATATRGDIIAIVLQFDAAVGSVYFRCSNLTSVLFPYGDLYTAAWVKSARIPLISLEYSDGSYAFNQAVPSMAPGAVYVINTGTTPDEVGNYFTLPVPSTVYGFRAYLDLDGDADIILYDSSNTVLASASASNLMRGGTATGEYIRLFTSTVNLAKDTVYRLVFKPTTATSTSISYFDVPVAAALNAIPFGTNMYATTRVDAGAWTEITTQRVMLSPLLSAFDDGVGGGGGLLTNPGMGGGMRG